MTYYLKSSYSHNLERTSLLLSKNIRNLFRNHDYRGQTLSMRAPIQTCAKDFNQNFASHRKLSEFNLLTNSKHTAVAMQDSIKSRSCSTPDP